VPNNMRRFFTLWLATPTPTLPPEVEEAMELFKTDPFHYFTRDGLMTDPVMRGMAADIYQLMWAVSLFLLAISTLYAVIKWGLTPAGQKSEGIVSVLGKKFFAIVFVTAFIGIATFILDFFNEMAGKI